MSSQRSRLLAAPTAGLLIAAVLVACAGAHGGRVGASSVGARPLPGGVVSPLPLAPAWASAPGAIPARPASCPPLPATGDAKTAAPASVRRRASLTGDPLW